MARMLTFKQSINEALAQEMARDETVIAMGEDIVGGMGGDGEMDAWGGVFGFTKGLHGQFGDRVMDTPITESAFIGAAAGAAACGMRPVAELMFIDFMGVCFDQIFNQAAKAQVHVWWQGGDPNGSADNDWRRFTRSFAALTVSLSDLYTRTWFEGSDSIESL